MKQKKRINEFDIGYMINSIFHVNKAFWDQRENFMNTRFGELTLSFIKFTLSKKNKSILALIMFHETRAENTKKYFRVLSFVIYAIIKNYVYIDYIYCKSKKISEINVGSRHGEIVFSRIVGIGIPDFLMNWLSCYVFLKNINSVVILKYPENYVGIIFSKGCAILECNTNNLENLRMR